jgi:hypothetical protein
MTAATNPANIPTTILSAFESMDGRAPFLVTDTVELGVFTGVVEVDDIGWGVIDTILEVVIEEVEEMEEMEVEDDVSVGTSVGVSVDLEKA